MELSNLQTLSCHFTWDVLNNGNDPRTYETITAENNEDESDETRSNDRTQWLNLMGYHKTKARQFEEARNSFENALANCTSDDQQVVTLSCLAWLFHEEAEDSNDDAKRRNLQEKSNENFEKVKVILNGREMENLPEVLFEKAFVVVNGSNRIERWEEANCLIDKALEAKPDEVVFKFTKVRNKQKLLFCSNKAVSPEDSEAKDLKQLWEDLKEESQHSTDLHAQVLVYYALFLRTINRDYGKSGAKYAKEAERLGADNPAVLRMVAKFYIDSAGNNLQKYNKAIEIFKNLLKMNPNSYKTQSLYGNALLQKYKQTWNEDIFPEAENNLKKSWDVNKSYLTPAFDLVRLYQTQYEKTNGVHSLIQAEQLFHQMLKLMEHLNKTFQAGLCSMYGQFLKKYATVVAEERIYNFSKSGYHSSAGADDQMMKQIKEAVEITEQFDKSQENAVLHEAEKIFQSLYVTALEDEEDDNEVAFYLEYGHFIKKYSKDLAMYYFKTSLEYNPRQNPRYTYDHLEELAKEKANSPTEEERFRGLTTLGWLYKLRYETRNEEDYRLKALEEYKKALAIKEDEEIQDIVRAIEELRVTVE